MSPAAEASAINEQLEEGLALLGYERFRPGQREAVETLIEEGRVLLVAPTGGGKSLTYQLPAVVLPGTTLVISPLIALMNDQVRALEERGIAATFIASTLSPDDMRERLSNLRRGQYKIVYVAPERLAFEGFRELLSQIDCPLVAVDEAHCISEWGHDFRPEYAQIGEMLALVRGSPRVIACTATATPVVRDEIVAKLGLGTDTPQHVRGFARPNLRLRAAEVSGKADRCRRVDALLAEALGGPGSDRGAAIIYSPTRRMAEEEAQRLIDAGWKAGSYHAGLSPNLRESVQRGFSNGSLEVIAATNAFGMGIDRSDVRAVIHLGPPGSIEAYYQEVGRAGRDGRDAWGLMLSAPNDMPRRRRLLESDMDGRAPDPRVIEHKWNLFLELMRWAEGGSCRHDAILRYFGDEAEALGGCGRCDVCESLDQTEQDAEEVSLLVRKALSGVARVQHKFGLNAAAKLVRGAKDERLQRAGLDQLSTYGILKEHSEDWLTRLLRRCVTAGWVGFTGGEHPLVFLTEEGITVMKGERPARLVLPPAHRPEASESRMARKRKVVASAEFSPDAKRLFDELRAWRLQLSKDEGVPPYVIA
ncbi:MAG: ATP-dependent DNA helicase RecQ, partial [Chrysiogenetes bacterium]|nr:ATP-dependent DNA helicase RecQ [Chrysiogenetes bacterium]